MTTRPVKVTPEVRGQPVQAAGVLHGQDVGRRHHLAQARADVPRLPERCATENQPSCHVSEPVTAAPSAGPPTLAAWRRYWLPSGRSRSRSRRPRRAGGVPRPRRDTTPPLPDDARRSWALAAVLGVATLVS